MKYLHRPDLPSPIVKALIDDSYSAEVDDYFKSLPDNIRQKYKGRSFSVTTLNKSPRQRILLARHHDEIEIDPIDLLWRMWGNAVHSILERFSEEGDQIEQRKGIVVGDFYVHAKVDRYSPRRELIQDYKVTSAESALYEAKVDYEFQLNVQSLIWRTLGFPVKRLENVYVYRNWKASKVNPNTAYPDEPIKVVQIPVWDDAKIIQTLTEKLNAHFDAAGLDDDALPFCTEQDRWQSLPLHKVFKIDEKTGEPQKVAKYKSNSELECREWIYERLEADKEKALMENASKAKPKPEEEVLATKVPKYTINTIPGKPVKCDYCDARAFCNQLQAELMENKYEESETPEE